MDSGRDRHCKRQIPWGRRKFGLEAYFPCKTNCYRKHKSTLHVLIQNFNKNLPGEWRHVWGDGKSNHFKLSIMNFDIVLGNALLQLQAVELWKSANGHLEIRIPGGWYVNFLWPTPKPESKPAKKTQYLYFQRRKSQFVVCCVLHSLQDSESLLCERQQELDLHTRDYPYRKIKTHNKHYTYTTANVPNFVLVRSCFSFVQNGTPSALKTLFPSADTPLRNRALLFLNPLFSVEWNFPVSSN